MKHSVILLAILALILSSCGTTTKITYGDISVLDLNGQTIQQWDHCTMDVEVTNDGYSKPFYTSHAIKNGGGLAFVDNTGEAHYVHGGVIIVNNIHDESYQEQVRAEVESKTVNELTKELKSVNQEISETLKYIRNNKKKSGSFSEYQEKQVRLKQLRQRKTQIENLLRERWRLD